MYTLKIVLWKFQEFKNELIGLKVFFMVIFVASSNIKFKKKCMYQTDIVKKVI